MSLEENNSIGSYVSWKADKIDGLIIDVKIPEDIISYLDSCVKEDLQIYMRISLCDGGPILWFSHLHGEREFLVSLAPKEPV